ncbi:MAG: hypothetical protein A2X61_00065 [Ignavibacteria bacterium GWB2_35_12]|nr:MAG: hypothetical protein A2X61_00065 [Ignavibacteria bacterium GWB2_35_12]OGU96201.1 MAG: hypothetical protein A2220_13515 [Ignavibacteria bacterium RIFOXYA2_FULL_35_10]OGV20705.1 MAG: hypothetical protein A2475_05890 [Ignavibacteria bacterium RIFOXYC2_FULL_35_21]
MKTLKHSIVAMFLIAFFFVGFSQHTNAQTLDSCLCIPTYQPRSHSNIPGQDTTWPFNKDTLWKLDTCNWYLENDYDNDCSEKLYYWWQQIYLEECGFRVYSRGNWEITFFFKAIDASTAPSGTKIIKKWYDIDSIQYPEVRNYFKLIEQDIGSFTFTKINPTRGSENNYDNWSDQVFDLYFDNNKFIRVPILDSVLKLIPKIYFSNPYIDILTGVTDKKLENNYSFKSYINTESSFLIIYFIKNYFPQNEKIKIFNIFGKLIIESMTSINNNYSQMVQIDISHLTNGIYFIQFNNEISKFIINK